MLQLDQGKQALEKEGMNPSGLRPFARVVSGIPEALHIRRGESSGRSLSEGNGNALSGLLQVNWGR